MDVKRRHPPLAEGDDLIKLKLRNRGNRLLRLIELGAPSIIVAKECDLIRAAVDEADQRWGTKPRSPANDEAPR